MRTKKQVVSISSFLNKPTSQDNRNIWIAGAFYGVAVYLLLILLQPFGLNNIGSAKYAQLLLFALVTWFGVVGVYYLFKLISKNFFNAGKWTVKKEIIYNVSVVCAILAGNFTTFIVLYSIPVNTSTILLVFWQTLAIATCIIGIKLLFNLRDSKSKPAVLKPNSGNEIITINGNGKSDLLNIPANELLFIESDKNYCNVITTTQTLQKRLTITSAEKQLSKHPIFTRCHRAYIVNKSKIITIDGNITNGYKLVLSDTGEIVPVSKSYLQNIKTE